MSRRTQTAWLQVDIGKEITLFDPSRLDHLVEGFPNPQSQRPLVLFCIGRRTCSLALQTIFRCDEAVRHDPEGVASLKADRSSISGEQPILLAETTLQPSTTADPVSGQQVRRFPLPWAECLNIKDLHNLIHARLFFTFAHIVCIFASDFPSFEYILDLLQAWAALSDPDTVGNPRPRIIIITEGTEDSTSPTYNLYAQRNKHYPLFGKLRKSFPVVLVESLPATDASSPAKFSRLEKLIAQQMEEVKQIRQACGTFFSASHLCCLFRIAVEALALNSDRPFNFIYASRYSNKISPDHWEHLRTFLDLGLKQNINQTDMCSYIASTILLDAYPPDMHRFEPLDIYQTLYQQACQTALVQSQLDPAMATAIPKVLANLFSRMIESGHSAARIHRDQTKALNIDWKLVRSNTTDLCCLRRHPEFTLTCGHSLCETCIRIHGKQNTASDYEYSIDACLLCGSGQLTKNLPPPTAGLRILSLDGGGAWGRLTLEIINLIQELVGTSYKFQDLFDIVYGTSVGGIIVLTLFLRRLPLTQCIRLFEDLAGQVFKRVPQEGFFKRFRRVLDSWFADEFYDSTALETALQAYLGHDARMFDYHQGHHPIRVGVTLTAINNPQAIVLTNYNGEGRRKSEGAYRHKRPEDVEMEPFMWKAGRATSAAPGFFKTTSIGGIGPVQDGAVSGHNNPSFLALWESHFVKPTISRFDAFLSLGTGFRKENSPTKITQYRNIWLDGFAVRLYRVFYKIVLDCQETSKRFENNLDDESRTRYFRLNAPLDGALALDDIDRLEEMRRCVYQPRIKEHCKQALYTLIISSFYYEFRSTPLPVNGRLQCFGHIRSRIPGHALRQIIQRLHPSQLIFKTQTRILGSYNTTDDYCLSCHRYRKQIHFSIRDLDECISIQVESLLMPTRSISAFPQKMQWFVDQQQLDSVFGAAHHSDLPHQACESCLKVPPNNAPGRLKRRVQWDTSLEPQHKRPRRFGKEKSPTPASDQ